MSGFIERSQWKGFLEGFSKRHQLQPTQLQVIGEMGAQQEEEHLPFVGVSFEPKGSAAGSVEVVLGGEMAKEPRRVAHTILKVQRIAPLLGRTGLEEGLGFETEDGDKALLLFETLREIPEKTSKGSQRSGKPGIM